MNLSSRWLVIFAIIIGLITVLAVSLVLFTQGKNVTLLAADTPQGTVQRYLIALKEKDYQTAYNYVSPGSAGSTGYNDWEMQIGNPPPSMQIEWQATLEKTSQNGNYATVDVNIETAYPGSMVKSSQYSQQLNFSLTKTINSWLIISPPYFYGM